MATNEIRIGMQFADETKKTYVIPDLPDGSLNAERIRTRVNELNNVIGGQSSADTLATQFGQAMTQTFISAEEQGTDPADEIYPLTKIYSATTVSKIEEVIYNGQ